MGRKIFLIAILIFVVSGVWGQAYTVSYTGNGGNPGGLNTETDDQTSGWTGILNPSVSTNVWSTTQNIPFDFEFMGDTVLTFRVSHNGLVTFGSSASPPSGENSMLPSPSFPDSSVACFWDAFTNSTPTGADDSVAIKVFGSGPNRQLWIKWYSFEYGDPSNDGFNYIACVLEETSNAIYLVDMYSDNSANMSTTIGMQHHGTCAVQYGDETESLGGNTSNGIADNDYYSFSPVASYSGAYSLGGSGADFYNFNNASSALGCGISGAVVLDVVTGTYTEQVSFSNVPGASSTNTITLESATSDSADVILSWPSSSASSRNYTLELDSASFYILQDLTIKRTGSDTYGAVIHISGDADSLVVDENHLVGGGGSTADAAVVKGDVADMDTLIFSNNAVEGGSYGLYISGENSSILQSDHQITGNTFSDHDLAAISLAFLDSAEISSNSISLSGSSARGIRIEDCKVDVNVSKNEIILTNGGTGIECDDCGGSVGNPVSIDHNMISVGGDGTNRYGIVLSNGSQYTEVIYNNVNIYSNTTGTRHAYSSSSTGSGNTVYNNCFVNAAEGYAVYATNATALGTSDHNNIYSNGTNLANINSTDYISLDLWQTGSSQDANSVSVDPLYLSNTDLHVAAVPLDAGGTGLSGASITDFDGDTRNIVSPDIGADEFEPTIYQSTSDACISADDITSSGSGVWEYLYKDRQVIAGINDNGNNLGTLSADVYINTGTLREDGYGTKFMDRNWYIDMTGSVTGSDPSLRIYMLTAEVNELVSQDASLTSFSDIGVTKYDGINENCDLTDNDVNTYTFYDALAVTRGTAWTSGYFLQVDVSGFSEFFGSGQGIVLPVELIEFTAESSDEMVMLKWKTAQDDGHSAFFVERSLDGVNFNQIGTVETGTFEQEINHYVFFDREYQNASRRYYRLKMVNFARTISYSDVVRVNTTSSEALSMIVSPVPATDRVVIRYQLVHEGTIHLRVFDLQGRLLFDHSENQVGGAKEIEIPTIEWEPGMYEVELSGIGQICRQRLIIMAR